MDCYKAEKNGGRKLRGDIFCVGPFSVPVLGWIENILLVLPPL